MNLEESIMNLDEGVMNVDEDIIHLDEDIEDTEEERQPWTDVTRYKEGRIKLKRLPKLDPGYKWIVSTKTNNRGYSMFRFTVQDIKDSKRYINYNSEKKVFRGM